MPTILSYMYIDAILSRLL